MNVPQIVPETGVSGDYGNEYFGKMMNFNRNRQHSQLSSLAEHCREYPVKKYEQRFSPEDYEDVITTQNWARVNRLNELSDIVNRTFVDSSLFTEHDFMRTINEVMELIYGSHKSGRYYKL